MKRFEERMRQGRASKKTMERGTKGLRTFDELKVCHPLVLHQYFNCFIVLDCTFTLDFFFFLDINRHKNVNMPDLANGNFQI